MPYDPQMFDRIKRLFGGTGVSQDPREAFLSQMRAVVTSHETVTRVERNPDHFGLDVWLGDERHALFLENVFAETREISPDERAARIQSFVGAMFEPINDDSWDAVVETFVPSLRAATYAAQVTTDGKPIGMIRRPFLPFIDILVAIDLPTSMRFVSQAKLATWKVTADQVVEAALARTHVLQNPPVDLYDEIHGPMWVVSSNDTYEASRLLIPGWLASFRDKVEGRPIAIFPERGTLVIGGDAKPEMIRRMLDMANREFDASTRRISPALYSVDDAGKVVPYEAPEFGALANAVRFAHEKLATYEYTQQKELLDAHFEKTGLDIFVASYKVFEDDAGVLRSFSVWTK